jgi:hypothetical protein
MRIIPRFSLRFALVALTIFLIVFGVGVKYWRAYQEHERVASQLVALGNKVEEESVTLYGLVIGKRITGLQFRARGASRESIALLTELPNPEALHRLTLCLYPENYFLEEDYESHPFAHEAIAAVAKFTSLEQLDLRMDIKEGVLEPLRALKNLRTLNFYECRINACQIVPLISEYTSLEVLRINGIVNGEYDYSELFELHLPRLRELSLSFGKYIQNLPLTKQGLGRFPKLEYLTLHHVAIKNVQLESGAMPKLKYLDLSEAGGGFEDGEINWKILPQVVPQLEGLDICNSQITSETIAIVAKMPKLKHLHLSGDRSIEQLQEMLLNDQYSYSWDYLTVETFAELMYHCSHLQFHGRSADLWKAMCPPDQRIEIPSWPSWDSTHWRTKVLN